MRRIFFSLWFFLVFYKEEAFSGTSVRRCSLILFEVFFFFQDGDVGNLITDIFELTEQNGILEIINKLPKNYFRFDRIRQNY